MAFSLPSVTTARLLIIPVGMASFMGLSWMPYAHAASVHDDLTPGQPITPVEAIAATTPDTPSLTPDTTASPETHNTTTETKAATTPDTSPTATGPTDRHQHADTRNEGAGLPAARALQPLDNTATLLPEHPMPADVQLAGFTPAGFSAVGLSDQATRVGAQVQAGHHTVELAINGHVQPTTPTNNGVVTEVPLAPGTHYVQLVIDKQAVATSPFTVSPIATKRIAGPTRTETALAIAEQLRQLHGAPTEALVVQEDALADAIAATPLAHHIHAPILVTQGATLTPATKAWLQAHPHVKVTIIGGGKAVSDQVRQEVAAITTTPPQRLSGVTRYETAVAIAQHLVQVNPDVHGVTLVDSNDWHSALPASAWAAREHRAVLYGEGTGLPGATETWLREHPGVAANTVAISDPIIVNAVNAAGTPSGPPAQPTRPVTRPQDEANPASGTTAPMRTNANADTTSQPHGNATPATGNLTSQPHGNSKSDTTQPSGSLLTLTKTINSTAISESLALGLTDGPAQPLNQLVVISPSSSIDALVAGPLAAEFGPMVFAHDVTRQYLQAQLAQATQGATPSPGAAHDQPPATGRPAETPAEQPGKHSTTPAATPASPNTPAPATRAETPAEQPGKHDTTPAATPASPNTPATPAPAARLLIIGGTNAIPDATVANLVAAAEDQHQTQSASFALTSTGITMTSATPAKVVAMHVMDKGVVVPGVVASTVGEPTVWRYTNSYRARGELAGHTLDVYALLQFANGEMAHIGTTLLVPQRQQPVLDANGFAVAPGTSDIIGHAGKLYTFTVAVYPGVGQDALTFSDDVQDILFHPKSWTAGGKFRLQRIDDPTKANIQVVLAPPSVVDTFCLRAGLHTGGNASCWNDHQSMINSKRWFKGVPHIADMHLYRNYLINHEVGHGLDHRHEYCPRPGAPAPVMQQQTYSLMGCVANGYPYP